MWNDKHYKIGLVRYNNDTIFSYIETVNNDAVHSRLTRKSEVN